MDLRSIRKMAPHRKAAMHKLMERWKEHSKPVEMLENALAHLASDERGKSMALFKKGQYPEYYVAYTLQRKKGMSPAVPVDDAKLLLDLIEGIRSQANGAAPDELATMVERAGQILLNGERMPKTFTDELWQPVLDVLRRIDPSIAQSGLF